MPFIQLQLRRSTSTEWQNASPPITLANGEIGLETDTRLFKIGDGVTVWNSLPHGGLYGPSFTTLSTSTATLTSTSSFAFKTSGDAVTTVQSLSSSTGFHMTFQAPAASSIHSGDLLIVGIQNTDQIHFYNFMFSNTGWVTNPSGASDLSTTSSNVYAIYTDSSTVYFTYNGDILHSEPIVSGTYKLYASSPSVTSPNVYAIENVLFYTAAVGPIGST